MLVKGSREVETRGLREMIGVDRGGADEAGGVVAGVFPPLLRCVGVFPRLVVAGGACEEGAGVDGSSSVDGPGVGVGVGVGRGVVTGGAEEGAGVGVLLPVPEACLFTPWWMYSSTPSRLKADDSAQSAKRASSHEFRNMFVCGGGKKRE